MFGLVVDNQSESTYSTFKGPTCLKYESARKLSLNVTLFFIGLDYLGFLSLLASRSYRMVP